MPYTRSREALLVSSSVKENGKNQKATRTVKTRSMMIQDHPKGRKRDLDEPSIASRPREVNVAVPRMDKRSPRETVPPKINKVTQTVKTINREIPTYNEEELQIMVDRMLTNFGAANRTLKVRSCAHKSWIEYWKHIGREAAVDAANLARYIVHQILGGKKISTVSTYLGGIGVVLVEAGDITEKQWDTIITSRLIREVKKAAVQRETLLGVKVRQSDAITVEELELLCKSANSYDEHTVAAAAITAFYNLHRGAELLQSDSTDNPLKRPYAGDVCIRNKTISYKIRSQKVRQFVVVELCLRSEEIPGWAYAMWERFWQLRSSAAISGHPDLFVKSTGKVLTAGDMNQFLSRGHRKLTTHSLRAGGATYMLAKGATVAQLCNKGRWSSVESLLRYLRKDPKLKELLQTVREFWGQKTLPELADE